MELEFKCKQTRKLYESGASKKFHSIARVALRKLDMMRAAVTLDDLKIPPSNRLELLRGKRKGQYSIRVNEQWRICFIWNEAANTLTDIEIVDYH